VADLAVSNIAWTNEEEFAAADKLRELGVTKIEIAPTKKWEDPTKIDSRETAAYTDWWGEYGIEVIAFQSMLFSRPDLNIFESEEIRIETKQYLADFLRLAGDMGARRLVFGSPKNRQRGNMDMREADNIAKEFFSYLGKVANDQDTILCIEPNAPQYNCDYITTASDGARLVRSIESKGVGLHLDTACMTLAGDDIGKVIRDNADILKHFHVSAPMLDRVYERDDVNYTAAADALRDINYAGVVSIEMKPGNIGENITRVEDAVRFVRSVFSVN
jgi:D-psicose/D-tagatose/L-ribulose 3-epimerase